MEDNGPPSTPDSGLDCRYTSRTLFERMYTSYIKPCNIMTTDSGSTVVVMDDGLKCLSLTTRTLQKEEPHSYTDHIHSRPSSLHPRYDTCLFGHEQSTNPHAHESPSKVSKTKYHGPITTSQTSPTSNTPPLAYGVGFSNKENLSSATLSFGGHKEVPTTSQIGESIVIHNIECDKRILQQQNACTSKVEPSCCVQISHIPDIKLSNPVTKSHTKVDVTSKVPVASQDLSENSFELFKTTSVQKTTNLDSSRYFGALKGVELETLKKSEGSLLPRDKKWPFLLRFPIGSFGVNLGLGSQAILWKLLAADRHHPEALPRGLFHAPHTINVVIWGVATVALMTMSSVYALKCVFYLEAVRREFNHPIRINFFFAPWISGMLLILGRPPSIHPPPLIWALPIIPIFALDLKVYGEWLSGGHNHLSRIANPCTHLSLLGNFVGALLAATFEYKELALFFWSIGFIHYIVLLVTLYQRLPSLTILPKDLHPIFFLFIGLPSCASVAWAQIRGTFDLTSRITYFVAIFLFFSLVARARLFWGFRFNIAWWAYTFPVTVCAIATIHYSLEVKNPFTQSLAIVLSISSSLIVVSLSIFTILHTFVWGSMFPNDMAIAITDKGIKVKRKIKVIEGEQHEPYGCVHATGF